MLTKQMLQEMRERLGKATPGPWVYMGDDPTFAGQVRAVGDSEDGQRRGVFTHIVDTPYMDARPDDMEFIAHSRIDMERLLDHVEEIEGLLTDLANLDQQGAYEKGKQEGRKEVSQLLKKLEWRGRKWGTTASRCVCCGEEKRVGHKEDCQLGNLLKGK